MLGWEENTGTHPSNPTPSLPANLPRLLPAAKAKAAKSQSGITGDNPSHLPVQPDGQDFSDIAVVEDLCPFLEVVDIHLLWPGMADHNHKAAGEQTLHDVNIWDFIWAHKESKAEPSAGSDCSSKTQLKGDWGGRLCAKVSNIIFVKNLSCLAQSN